ncbi:hypothetical protein M569_02898 [Genlisea aurea]|uniref:Protein arginine N-methyltransferase 2 n=1 Tax=Genlisea aurea TaxID=192259 RepID=S8CY10_9LAMI|nr:hypothetical protein M569_02898 [Genlisea aurea]
MDENREEPLCQASAVGDINVVRSLIAAGADATYFDGEGLTPLMHAAKAGNADVAKYLLDCGAPWNALSPNGLSAGDFAMENGHQSVYNILLNAGIQAELILNSIARKDEGNGTSNMSYLEDRVAFSEDKVMDTERKAVMMAWEGPLMEAHAKAVCSVGGGDVLNIGFGMGLVDTAIQQYSPKSHTIVEAHPEVYDRMVRDGWDKKHNVKIVFGRWQDVISQLESYDGIFFDTYGEYYEDMRDFHGHLPKLLKRGGGGVYSFFNGLCGSNPFFHVVYCEVVGLELEKLGFSTAFIPLPVKDCLGEKVWEGVKHRYWELDTYFLPVCQHRDDDDDA